MDGKQKEILKRNRQLLAKNIILTEEFLEHLRSYNVLPETMINDVQSKSTKEKRILKLLELLEIRGCDAYRKLRHVLQLTGHNLLADHLYEEETDNKVFKADDIFNKFPSVFNHISDDTKMKLLRCLESKVKERYLLNQWQQNPDERTQGLETRKGGFETEKFLRVNLENKRRQVQDLQEELMKVKEEAKNKDLEIESLRLEIDERRRKSATELAVQAKFNSANSNSIFRLKERFTQFNGRVRMLNIMLRNFLGEKGEVVELDPDNTKLSFLEMNIKHLLKIVQESTASANDVTSERESILQLLKYSSNTYEPLHEIMRKYVNKEDKWKAAVHKEIVKLGEVFKTSSRGRGVETPPVTDLKILRTLVTTARVEVEHILKKLQWKDNQITELLDENASLRQSPTSRRGSSGSSLRTKTISGFGSLPISPVSTIEMQDGCDSLEEFLVKDTREFTPRLAVSRDFLSDTNSKHKQNGFLGDMSVDRSPTTDHELSHQSLSEGIDRVGTFRKFSFQGDSQNAKINVKVPVFPEISETDIQRQVALKKRIPIDLTSLLEQTKYEEETERIARFEKLPAIFEGDVENYA